MHQCHASCDCTSVWTLFLEQVHFSYIRFSWLRHSIRIRILTRCWLAKYPACCLPRRNCHSPFWEGQGYYSPQSSLDRSWDAGYCGFFSLLRKYFLQFHLIFSYENKKIYYYYRLCILGMNGKSPQVTHLWRLCHYRPTNRKCIARLDCEKGRSAIKTELNCSWPMPKRNKRQKRLNKKRTHSESQQQNQKNNFYFYFTISLQPKYEWLK